MSVRQGSWQSENPSTYAEFQESEYFGEKAKERYKTEAKNSELKKRHKCDSAVAAGLGNMELQGALWMYSVGSLIAYELKKMPAKLN